MAEPNTVNVALIVPSTGDLVGAWGTSALNPDMVALDGMLGGFAVLSLAAASTFALSLPSGSLTPGAGPNQSQTREIKLTGTLSGNNVIQLTMPGDRIWDNRCTVGAFYVQLAPAAGTGTAIGLPPGQKVLVHFDGTNVDYVNMPPVGSALDLHGATAVPAWMNACSVAPYLIKDGSTYSASAFPALAAQLGSTFGGNGITTFGVPDERNRARIGLDTNGPGTFSNRVTSTGSGINGQVMGAAGGDQLPQAHSHGYTDPGHDHSLQQTSTQAGASYPGIISGTGPSVTGTSTINITITTTGAGAGQNMPPSIVSFLSLIKT